MEQKHTPGPWSLTENERSHSINTMPLLSGRNVVNVVDLFCEKLEDTKENRANLQLIATAPELLEALKEVAHYMDMDEKEGSGGYTIRARHSVREAITKATK